MTVVVLVVAVVCAVASYLTWTASRLDRLSSRVETAWAALDAQLVRRSATAGELAAHARRRRLAPDETGRLLESAALEAAQSSPGNREAAENALSRAIRDFLGAAGPLGGEKTQVLLDLLEATSARVAFARQFYNDAVRDNRALRRRWVCRLLRVLRRDTPRGFFEIDETALTGPEDADRRVS